MGVADLLRARPLLLAGALVSTAHQARVGQEVPRLREPGDGVDLVQEGESQDRADARHGAEQVFFRTPGRTLVDDVVKIAIDGRDAALQPEVE